VRADGASFRCTTEQTDERRAVQGTGPTRRGKAVDQLQDGGCGQATPMPHGVNGKQSVLVVAGGHGSFETTLSDAVVVYALR